MDAQANAPNDHPQLSPAARKFLEETTLKSILGIGDAALDPMMAVAYRLYQVGRYTETEVFCRGLIAADHKAWWPYSLYAATLRRLGRLPEALVELEKGLTWSPNEPKLLFMRGEIREALAQQQKAAPAALPTPTPHVAA